MCILLVIVSICEVTFGCVGHLAEAVRASSTSRCSNSWRRDELRIPTLGAGCCCARHFPRPLPLPVRITAGGVSGTTAMSISFSGVLMSARCGVAGGVITSVVGMYCTATLFAGCAV